MRTKTKSPVITLTTDFGNSNYFVGAMKGVILGINSKTKIVDITHNISPFNIAEGAFLLGNAYSYFLEKTIHLIVVDPGVGSKRRPVIAKTKDYFFVAPDNGVLSYIYQNEKDIKIYEITNDEYFLKPVSQTFHGRDIFAPVAAHLSKGIACEKFGSEIKKFTQLPIKKPVIRKNLIVGNIIYSDRFGNLITNISRKDFEDVLSKSKRKLFEIKVNNYKIKSLLNSYSNGKDNALSTIWGSHGNLELFLKEGNAGSKLRIKISARVSVNFF